jgi:hypothetical protein
VVDTLAPCAEDDLVVDVGHVLDEPDVEPGGEVTAQHVEDDGGAPVSDVGVTLDGRPAHVHADATRLGGHERDLLATEGVVEHEGMVAPA